MTEHDKAMELAEKGHLAKKEGKVKEAFGLFTLAALRETVCALNATEEPSRSVLFRSAAALALEAGLPMTAQTITKLGLSGTPPDEIRKELEDVLDRAAEQVECLLGV